MPYVTQPTSSLSSRFSSWVILLVLLMGAVACGEDEAPKEEAFSGPEDYVEEQTKAMVSIYCKHAVTCPGALAIPESQTIHTRYSNIKDCEANWNFVFPQLDDGLTQFKASLDAKRVSFSESQAKSCLEEYERVEAIESCEEFGQALAGLHDFAACRNISKGLVSLSGECSRSQECAPSGSGTVRACAAIMCPGSKGTCIEPQGNECPDRCQANEFCDVQTRSCTPIVKAFERCTPDSQCEIGTTCSAFGRCFPDLNLARDAQCTNNGQCAAGFFCSARRTCDPVIFNGPDRPCSNEFGQGAGLCQAKYHCEPLPMSDAGLCKPLVPQGGTCRKSSACVLGLVCTGVTATVDGTCTNPLNNGTACSPEGDSNQCLSNYCSPTSNTCVDGPAVCE